MYTLLKFIPKNHLSYLVGRFARISRPKVFIRFCIRIFSRYYSINVDEAKKPLGDYCSLAEFFTRDLKPGVREIGPGIVSPVDGVISNYGELVGDNILQVKGKTYSVHDLLQHQETSTYFVGGYFITFYLAPPDYHHIHSPVDGSITEMCYIPGKLWPVNSWSVNNITNLFSINERIVTVIDSSLGKVAIVKVGATNVGSITLSYDDVVSNSRPSLFTKKIEGQHKLYSPPIKIGRGMRIGTFNMGSSVVMLFEAGKFKPKNISLGVVKYGMSL
jgi:phosphatidylserine decarboxylase